jgi:hypothetical protein
MIQSKTIEAQISRLLRLPFAPTDPQESKYLRTEYRAVLADCRSESHLVAVCDYLVRNRQNDGRGGEIARVPAPADVHAAVVQVPDPINTRAPGGCGHCFGGFIQIAVRGLSCADYCDCSLGQFLREGHRRYFEERASGNHR